MCVYTLEIGVTNNAPAYRPLSTFKTYEITAVFQHHTSFAVYLFPIAKVVRVCSHRRIFIGLSDGTESMVTIQSPFCGYNMI